MFAKAPFRIQSYLRSTTYDRSLTCSTKHADFVLQDKIGTHKGVSWSRCITASIPQFAIAPMCKIKYDYKMAMVGLTQLFLVLVNCVLCTQTDLEDKRRIKIKLLENIANKRLYSKRKAAKMFAKTLLRIESYLRSTTYVRDLTCSTQHADFVLQHKIGENGRASWSRCIKVSIS